MVYKYWNKGSTIFTTEKSWKDVFLSAFWTWVVNQELQKEKFHYFTLQWWPRWQNLSQLISIGINWYQLVSIDLNWYYQMILIDLNWSQLISIDINWFSQKFRPIWSVLIVFLKFSKFLKKSKKQKNMEKLRNQLIWIDLNWSQMISIDLKWSQFISIDLNLFFIKKK